MEFIDQVRKKASPARQLANHLSERFAAMCKIPINSVRHFGAGFRFVVLTKHYTLPLIPSLLTKTKSKKKKLKAERRDCNR